MMANEQEFNQPSTSIPEQQVLFPPPSNPLPAKQEASTPKVNPIPSHQTPKPSTRPSLLQQNWEKLIGENLISKLGILITKRCHWGHLFYWKASISPIARIILGKEPSLQIGDDWFCCYENAFYSLCPPPTTSTSKLRANTSQLWYKDWHILHQNSNHSSRDHNIN